MTYITYNISKSKFLIILDYTRVVRRPEQLVEAKKKKKKNERKELTYAVQRERSACSAPKHTQPSHHES